MGGNQSNSASIDMQKSILDTEIQNLLRQKTSINNMLKMKYVHRDNLLKILQEQKQKNKILSLSKTLLKTSLRNYIWKSLSMVNESYRKSMKQSLDKFYAQLKGLNHLAYHVQLARKRAIWANIKKYMKYKMSSDRVKYNINWELIILKQQCKIDKDENTEYLKQLKNTKKNKIKNENNKNKHIFSLLHGKYMDKLNIINSNNQVIKKQDSLLNIKNNKIRQSNKTWKQHNTKVNTYKRNFQHDLDYFTIKNNFVAKLKLLFLILSVTIITMLIIKKFLKKSPSIIPTAQ